MWWLRKRIDCSMGEKQRGRGSCFLEGNMPRANTFPSSLPSLLPSMELSLPMTMPIDPTGAAVICAVTQIEKQGSSRIAC
jgi:hypothetical protein